jgi:hypothetical protein
LLAHAFLPERLQAEKHNGITIAIIIIAVISAKSRAFTYFIVLFRFKTSNIQIPVCRAVSFGVVGNAALSVPQQNHTSIG